MISQTAQYALRAIVCLAIKPNVSLTTQQLAEMTKVPSKYLSKVMQALARANLVTSKPGKQGGFSLKATPSEISLLTVVDAIDSPVREEHQHFGLQSYGNPLCPLHQRLNALNKLMRLECSKITIVDLIS
jgi:Rrf2 family transcriptional regulator, nitric oxide-sensitive transcriptional repressor